MIVVSLWWWTDLNEELDETPLSRAFRAWRLPASVAAAGGVVVQLPFQGCVSVESLAGDAFCAPWLEPPKFAAGLEDSGLDLLDKCLKYAPNQRISAKQALDHAYFDDLDKDVI